MCHALPSRISSDAPVTTLLVVQVVAFEPMASGATATAQLATVQNQALHNPGAPPGTLQVSSALKLRTRLKGCAPAGSQPSV